MIRKELPGLLRSEGNEWKWKVMNTRHEPTTICTPFLDEEEDELWCNFLFRMNQNKNIKVKRKYFDKKNFVRGWLEVALPLQEEGWKKEQIK